MKDGILLKHLDIEMEWIMTYLVLNPQLTIIGVGKKKEQDKPLKITKSGKISFLKKKL